ncbi:hypothetical protein [Poseidonocella pacifica]|uniref:hypothetical protein n=1 Tax=Poseidonocella pacifica TaxID=871651 RepID=UPI001113723B|nr:hypothetical protein [Poseidonocella pacifica]
MAALPRPGPANSISPPPRPPWPKSLPDQIAAVRDALEDLGEADAEIVARTFLRGRATTVAPTLKTVAGLAMAEMTEEGRYVT